MNTKLIEWDGIQLTVPYDWQDITDEVDAPDPPFTLADPENGVGALQFSIALYQGGALPNPSEEDLRDLGLRHGELHALGEPFDEAAFSQPPLLGAGISFHDEEYFIRVWHVSDGRSFVCATYVCTWGRQQFELACCEDIVRSLRFTSTV